MTVYISTSCLANGRNIFHVLDIYSRADLTNIELGVSHDYIDGFSSTRFKKYNFNAIVHHYFPPPKKSLILNLASQDPVILKRSKYQIKESIEFCHSTGAELLTFHAGFRVDPDDKLRFSQEQPIPPYEKALSVMQVRVKTSCILNKPLFTCTC